MLLKNLDHVWYFVLGTSIVSSSLHKAGKFAIPNVDRQLIPLERWSSTPEGDIHLFWNVVLS